MPSLPGSQVTGAQTDGEPVQSNPGSIWQVEEQPSPLTVFPSSHCSPASTTPLPQTDAVTHVPFWQVWPPEQMPQLTVPPQPLSACPQVFPAHAVWVVSGVQLQTPAWHAPPVHGVPSAF